MFASFVSALFSPDAWRCKVHQARRAFFAGRPVERDTRPPGWMLLALGFALGVLAVHACPTARALPKQKKRDATPRRVFEQTLEQLQRDYVEPRSPDQWYRALAKCASEQLDPYTYFFTPQQRKAHGTQGLGLALARSPGAGQASPLRVVGLAPHSPAARAGIVLGMPIDAINGRDAASFRKQAQIDLELVPKASTPLRLQSGARRFELRPLNWEPQKDLVTHPFPCAGGTCLYVRLSAFRSGVAHQLRGVLRPGEGSPFAGVLLDLRANPGGEIQEAVAVADMFLSQGRIVRLRGRKGVVLQDHAATAAETMDPKVPVVVLIDQNSASASELLAAALQDHGRALVVGERSFGKGSVQGHRDFADGSRLRYTRAHYFSPKDHAIHQRGVTPDLHLHVSAPPRAAKGALRKLLAHWPNWVALRPDRAPSGK